MTGWSRLNVLRCRSNAVQQNADRRIVRGLVAIIAGSTFLTWQPGVMWLSTGALLIVAACLRLVVDYNSTAKSRPTTCCCSPVSRPLRRRRQITLGLLAGGRLPAAGPLAATPLGGLAGYGLSQVLFVVAKLNFGLTPISRTVYDLVFKLSRTAAVGLCMVSLDDFAGRRGVQPRMRRRWVVRLPLFRGPCQAA